MGQIWLFQRGANWNPARPCHSRVILAGIQELFKLVPGFRREDVRVDAGFHRHDVCG